MNRLKNRTSKIGVLAIVVLLALTIPLVFSFSNGISVFAAAAEVMSATEAKIYSNATINEDFDEMGRMQCYNHYLIK